MKAMYLTALSILMLMPAQLFAQSMYSDIKARKVGDVITVILSENISGSAQTDATTQSNTAGAAASSISGNFIPFEPFFGADATVDFNSDERMFANQSQLLRGTVSVRIEEVTGSGELLVKGSRSTEINGELHKMEVEGIVRSYDINDLNQVMSYNIANAVISYQQEQKLKSSRRKAGFFRRAVFFVAGAVATAAIFLSNDSSGN